MEVNVDAIIAYTYLYVISILNEVRTELLSQCAYLMKLFIYFLSKGESIL